MNVALALVCAVSVVVGLLMVVIFRYTSNQKAIKRAKDLIQAHLLSVRLFQDQLRVVLGSYGGILRALGRYLRLSFTPLLVVTIPLTLGMIQLDRYLGWTPIQPGQAFLVKAKVKGGNAEAMNDVSLKLPPGITASAPAVHVLADQEIIWRLVAADAGQYYVGVSLVGQNWTKQVNVSAASSLPRISSVRLSGDFWGRLFNSSEDALPDGSPIQAIAVSYLPREISIFGFAMNWIVLFFVVSLAAGFIFKSVLGIEI